MLEKASMTFARITEDSDADARFDMLLRLAETFSKTPRERWGYSRAEIDAARFAMPRVTLGLVGPCLPAALARWYETVGRVPELTTSQNRLHAPLDVWLKNDLVVIYTENQGCAFWGIRVSDLGHDDPPIICMEEESCHVEAKELSRFALRVGLSELCLSASAFFCGGSMDDAAIAAFHSALRPVPVSTLSWPSLGRHACFLCADDVLVLVESEFFFALGTRSNIKDYLGELAAPGHIDWTEV
jgi:hypothetical protein